MNEPISPGRQVLLLISLIIGGLLIAGPLLFILFVPLFGEVDLEHLTEDMNVYQGLLMFACSQLGMIILPFFVFLKVTGQKFRDVIHFDGWKIKTFGLVIAALILGFLASYLLADLNYYLVEQMPDSGFLEMKEASELQMMGWFTQENQNLFPVALIVVALMPAIVEELVFRGLLQTKLIQASNDNVHFGVIVSGTIFAALHMQAWNLLPMIALGVLFGYVYHYTKDIRYTMFMHFIFNGVQISFMFFAPELVG
ncbi:MAG: CPBP family intramembrane glutamic endopeptidase [Crocinitomicaceae bacterium]